MEKYYVSYNKIHSIMKDLSEQILASGFEPDYIVAIGTGGFIPARMIKTFINIGVNTGVLPTKGLTLPFISAGGSSLLVACMAIGLITRVYMEGHARSSRR